MLIFSNGRTQVYVNVFEWGIRTPCGYNAGFAGANMFATRTNWDLTRTGSAKRLRASRRREAAARSNRFESHECGFSYDSRAILEALSQSCLRCATNQTQGIWSARAGLSLGYYAGRNQVVPVRTFSSTTSTSEGYSYAISNALQSGRRSPGSFTELSAVRFSAVMKDVKLWILFFYMTGGTIDFMPWRGHHCETRAVIVRSPQQSNRAFHQVFGADEVECHL